MAARRSVRRELDNRSLIYPPRWDNTGGPGLVITNARTATHLEGLDIGKLFANMGYLVATADYSGIQKYGNDTASALVGNARTMLTAQGASPIYGLGPSMGALSLLNYTRTHLTDFAKFAFAGGVLDLDYLHDNPTIAGINTEIEAAYGGSLAAWDAAKPTHSPIEFVASLTGIPMKYWGTSVDELVVWARAQAFATAHGNMPLVDMGAANHGDVLFQIGQADWVTQIVSFFQAP